MSLPNRSTKLKVAFGYILLTALLFISIGYIYQEMKSLSGTGDDEAILSQRHQPNYRPALSGGSHRTIAQYGTNRTILPIPTSHETSHHGT